MSNNARGILNTLGTYGTHGGKCWIGSPLKPLQDFQPYTQALNEHKKKKKTYNKFSKYLKILSIFLKIIVRIRFVDLLVRSFIARHSLPLSRFAFTFSRSSLGKETDYSQSRKQFVKAGVTGHVTLCDIA